MAARREVRPNAQPPQIPLIDVKLGMRGAGVVVDTGFAIGADRGFLKPRQC